jgi:hypothetical protein
MAVFHMGETLEGKDRGTPNREPKAPCRVTRQVSGAHGVELGAHDGC